MQWSVERFIEHLFVFLAIFGAAVLQRVFSCILFLPIIFQGVRAVTKPQQSVCDGVVPKSYSPKGQPRSTRNEFPIRADFGNSRKHPIWRLKCGEN